MCGKCYDGSEPGALGEQGSRTHEFWPAVTESFTEEGTSAMNVESEVAAPQVEKGRFIL